MADLIRSVSFDAAWDKRDPEPSKNYGVNGVNIRFIVRGAEGAVLFFAITNWQLPEVVAWHRTLRLGYVREPICAPYSVHSFTQREGWDRFENCDLLGGTCWHASSSYTEPDAIWERMLREGDAGFWDALEKIYRGHLIVQPEGPC